jgi:hypothetical protein
LVFRRGDCAHARKTARRFDKPAESEAEHFMPCPNCGVSLDLRDLGQVLEHDTPLHIEQGRKRKQDAVKAARSAKSARKRA